jgi:hypothetical protein
MGAVGHVVPMVVAGDCTLCPAAACCAMPGADVSPPDFLKL